MVLIAFLSSERGTVALGGFATLVQYSPTQRKYFVCNNRLAGARYYIQSNFIHNADQFKYLDMACFDCVIKANAYYDGSDVFDKPDAKGVAYVEYDAKYKNEEGSIGTSYGIADASFDY